MSAFDWFQHKVTRRTAVKGAAAGALGGALAIGGYTAAVNEVRADARPLTDEEFDGLWKDTFFGASRLIDPPTNPNEIEQHHIDMGYYLGVDGRLIADPDVRAIVVADQIAWHEAWVRKDRGYFRNRVDVPLQQDGTAEAHTCSTWQWCNYHIHLRSTQYNPSGPCYPMVECWWYIHCHDDFHTPGWCRVFCGSC